MTKRTTSQALDDLSEIEGVRISQTNFRKSMERAGVQPLSRGMWDMEAVLEARKRGKERDKNKPQSGPVNDAKRRKTELECKVLEAKLATLNGSSVLRTDHEETLRRIGTYVKQTLEHWAGSLPPVLEMRPAADVSDRIRKAVSELLSGMHNTRLPDPSNEEENANPV